MRRRIFLQNCRMSLHEVSRSFRRMAKSDASCPVCKGEGDHQLHLVWPQQASEGAQQSRPVPLPTPALTCRKDRSLPTSTLMQSKALWVNCKQAQVWSPRSRTHRSPGGAALGAGQENSPLPPPLPTHPVTQRNQEAARLPASAVAPVQGEGNVMRTHKAPGFMPCCRVKQPGGGRAGKTAALLTLMWSASCIVQSSAWSARWMLYKCWKKKVRGIKRSLNW